ncbi:MAG: DUF4126 domain-containing protein [bacterium]|nr:DUF4126 domain-containing protein [bacterium]
MSTILTVLAIASAAGINAYATLLVLGLCVRFELVPLQSTTAEFFTNPWVLGLLTVLYLIEFVADKIPAVDHVWDVIHTFIRPLAGAVASIAVVGGSGEGWVILAAVVGGATSLLSHGVKATGRVATTTLTGGSANWMISLVEDVIAIVGSLLALLAPFVALTILLAALAWLISRRRNAHHYRRKQPAPQSPS